jgi:hypothetical protein
MVTAIIVSTIVTALLQLAAHVITYPNPRLRLTDVQAYIVGTTNIGIGWSIFCLMTEWYAGLTWWTLPFFSGVVVCVARWIDERNGDISTSAFEAGRQAGRVNRAKEEEVAE